MNGENKSYDEIQSKTVLLEDNDGVNDMLSALNTGRAAMDKRKKELEREEKIKKIAIIVSVLLVLSALLIGMFIVLSK